MMTNFAAKYHNSFYATAAPAHLDYSTSLMNAAVAHSTISTMSSRLRSVPLSWQATEPQQDLLSKSSIRLRRQFRKARRPLPLMLRKSGPKIPRQRLGYPEKTLYGFRPEAA